MLGLTLPKRVADPQRQKEDQTNLGNASILLVLRLQAIPYQFANIPSRSQAMFLFLPAYPTTESPSLKTNLQSDF